VTPATSSGTGRRAPSVRSRLLWLVLACLLPAALVAALAIAQAYRERRSGLVDQAMVASRSTMVLVDAELRAAIADLQALATEPTLVKGDLAAFDAHVRRVLPFLAGNNIVLSDADGQQRINTLLPPGTALPRHGAPELLQRVLTLGRPVVSDVFIGGATRRPLIAVEVPVRAGGLVVQGLAMGFFPERIAALLPSPPGPDWVIGVFDRSGTIVARSRGAERLVGTKGAPALVQALARADRGLVETETVDGTPVLAAFSRSPDTGWAVAVGVPQAVLLAGLHRWLQALLVTTAVLCTLGAGLALLLARRIAGAIDALVAPAAALGRGEPVAIAPLALGEADRVAAALVAAARLLQERTSERDRTALHNEQLTRAAAHDPLTGLASRSGFRERLAERIAAHRDGGALTVFYLDLDDFKPVNDRHGHAVGDELLRAFAARLRAGIRESDVAARLGGDEFAVLIDGLSPAAAEPIAESLLERLCRPYALRDLIVPVTACIGVAGCPADGTTVDALLEAADQAMYSAKAAGKCAFRRSGFSSL
jgi:diguanylate cyclase (GGDEF)-like protein